MLKRKGDMKLRRSAPRLKPKERTYAHSAKLWVKRGGAPSRYSMLAVLFGSQKSAKNKISYHRPTMHSEKDDGESDGEEDEMEEEEAPQHTAIYIDDCARFYFFPKKRAESAGGDAELTGIFLLRSVRDSEMPAMGEPLRLYRVFGSDLYEFAPYPTREQRQEANRLHPTRNDELRLKLADWFGLIQSKQDGGRSFRLNFTPENFTRKSRMTTGRIGGYAN